jgi:hypothetical protein
MTTNTNPAPAEEKEEILTEEEVKKILDDLDVFECRDENLKLIRKGLSDIDPTLQQEWEKVYREKWVDRATFAAHLYQNINRSLSTDYYSNIITTILNGDVPPFWSCVDPDLDAFRAEADKTGSKVDPMAVINVPVPNTKEECKNMWGMFSNENVINVINFLKENRDASVFEKEEMVRLTPEGAKKHNLEEGHLCMVLKTASTDEKDYEFLPVTHYPPEEIQPMVKVLVMKDKDGSGGYPLMVQKDHITTV